MKSEAINDQNDTVRAHVSTLAFIVATWQA